MKKYKFADCGCEFDVDTRPDGSMELILNADMEVLPLNCPRTWEFFKDGDSKGCFQLESQQARQLAAKTQPDTIELLAALVSIIRPGCAEAMIGDKSVTDHFIARRHGEEEVTYYHPILKNSLSNTYGLLVYQEQAMQIAKDVAGFNLQEADNLRKAIGKKIPELMAKIKLQFIERAKALGVVTEKEAEEIFSWIEKSQRYSFNASHAVSYAFNAYLAAYAKAHFIRPFFTSYLATAKSSPNKRETHELISNAKSHSVKVVPPDFRMINISSRVKDLRPATRYMLRDKVIYVGFGDIKEVGASTIDKFISVIPTVEAILAKPTSEWSWLELLLFFSTAKGIVSKAFKAMIAVGCFDYMGLSRTRMIYEYDVLGKIKDKELLFMQFAYLEHDELNTLRALLGHLVSCGSGKQAGISSKPRLAKVVDIIKTLDEPGYILEDSQAWIAVTEQAFIGIPLTCSRVDGRDTGSANCDCHEFASGIHNTALIAAEIVAAKVIKTKTGANPGREMSFLSISDRSGTLENVVIFPDVWEQIKGFIVEGNILLFGGEKGKKNSFNVKNVWQI